MRSALLTLTLLASSFSVFSAEYISKSFQYSDSGRDGMTQNYYSCDSASDTLRDHLETLGAIDISVRCSGGIDYGRYMPVNLTSSFKVTAYTDPSTAKIDHVTIKSRMGDAPCFFNTKLLKEVVKHFPNVYVDSKKASCFDNRTSWNYVLRIAR